METLTQETEIQLTEISEPKLTGFETEDSMSPGLKVKENWKNKRVTSIFPDDQANREPSRLEFINRINDNLFENAESNEEAPPREEIREEELLSDVKIESTQEWVAHPMYPLGFWEALKESRKQLKELTTKSFENDEEKGVYDSEDEKDDNSVNLHNLEDYFYKHDDDLNTTKIGEDSDEDALDRSIEEPIERDLSLLLDFAQTSTGEIIEHLQVILQINWVNSLCIIGKIH